MKSKIEQYQKVVIDFVKRLSDVRFAGQILFVVIVLLISWSGVKTVQTNYGLQKQIATLQQQNAVQQLQNNNLKLQNEYYNSNAYLELSARQNFGLANPGEKELIVPENVALSYAPSIPAAVAKTDTTAKQPTYERHFQAWVNFFLHRQSVSDS